MPNTSRIPRLLPAEPGPCRRRDRVERRARRTSYAAITVTGAEIKQTSGPVVLVGHSYGGFVITNAAAGAENVRALVYVDAFIPDEGETVFQILGGSGSAFDIPDPTAVFDLVGYPGAPEGDVEAFLKPDTCTPPSPKIFPRPTAC